MRATTPGSTSSAFVGTLQQVEEIVELGPVFLGEREFAMFSRDNVLGT
jgi:hypothetical protein